MRRTTDIQWRRQQQLQTYASSQPGSLPYENHRPIRIPYRYHNQPVQSCVEGLCPHVSIERWKVAAREGRLRINDQVMKLEDPLPAGTILTFVVPNTVEPKINPNITINYEDNDLLVFNKPAPLPVHPCGRFNRNSLLYFTQTIWPELRLRPAHRLDASTTGLVIMTKNRQAARNVQSQFADQLVNKSYLVKVRGIPHRTAFRVDTPITKEPSERGKRMVSTTGYPACTNFRVLKVLPNDKALLMARPKSGRTNQIRLHLESVGLPIEGDHAYGGAPPLREGIVSEKTTLHLHAWQLELTHPSSQKTCKFVSPIPPWADSDITIAP